MLGGLVNKIHSALEGLVMGPERDALEERLARIEELRTSGSPAPKPVHTDAEAPPKKRE
jgi:hypothetical protein